MNVARDVLLPLPFAAGEREDWGGMLLLLLFAKKQSTLPTPPLRCAQRGGEKRQALPDHVSRKVTLRLNTGLPAVWS